MIRAGGNPARKISFPYRAKPVHLIALQQTCRLLYVDLLYSQNTPDFSYADSFLCFAQSVLPERLARVRRTNLTCMGVLDYHTEDVPWDMYTWLQLCAVLQNCAGLVQLTVRLGLLIRRRATEEQTRLVFDAPAQRKYLVNLI
ncbi:hypothetical protein MY11210_006921 [Beauveria gryllotalpidicola]